MRMRRLLTSIVIVIVIFLVPAVPCSGELQKGLLRFVLDGTDYHLDTVVWEEELFVSLGGLIKSLDLELKKIRNPRGWIIYGEKGRAAIKGGTSLAVVNDDAVLLSSPVRLMRGKPYTPVDFIRRVITAISAVDVIYKDEPGELIVNRIREETPPVSPRAPGSEEVVRTAYRQEIPSYEPPPEEVLAQDRFNIVVLDPGHGGEETGAVGRKGLLEKDLTLDIAQQLKRVIETTTGIRVILTRDGDYNVSLTDRTTIANMERADLFISIHANWSKSPHAGGAETYFLSSKATDEAARRLALVENRREGGFSSGGLELILWDMAQSQYLEESEWFGEVLQSELNVLTGVRNRGVKQALFTVLVGATMPAVLVEIGFLSSPGEEKKLSSEDYKDKIVDAFLRSILKYKVRFDKKRGL